MTAETPDADPANYPTRLVLTAGTFETFREDAVERAGAAEAGESPDAVTTVEDVTQLRELLSPRRLELIDAIATDPPSSISALADRLGRNYSDVHSDVSLLVGYNIAILVEEGRAKRPVIPYDEVVIKSQLL